MRKNILFFMTTFLFVASSVLAQESSRWILDSKASQATFFLASTLHDVTGTVENWQGFLNWDESVSEISGENVFQVESMATGNKTRDRRMKQMFDAEHFPKIVYQFDHTDMPKEQTGQIELHGRLTIRGVTRVFPVVAHVENKDGSMTLSGESDISLNAFQLKPPGVLGVIKVNDRVHVKFQAVYRQGK